VGEEPMRSRKPRPSDRKVRVKLYRPLIKLSGFQQGIRCVRSTTCFKSQAAQIRIVGLGIVCRSDCQSLLLATSELRLQRLRYSLGDLALNPKDVSQLPVVGVSP